MNPSITFEKIAIKIHAFYRKKKLFSNVYKEKTIASFESKSGHQNLFIILDKLHLLFPRDRLDHVVKK